MCSHYLQHSAVGAGMHLQRDAAAAKYFPMLGRGAACIATSARWRTRSDESGAL
jgi:hypothetical protein